MPVAADSRHWPAALLSASASSRRARSASGPAAAAARWRSDDVLVLDQLGRARVQLRAAGRADLVVDRGGDERVREGRGRDRRRVDPAQQAGVARLLERGERLLDPAERAGGRERRARTEDGDRLQQPRGVVRAGGDAVAHDRRERARRREVVLAVPRVRRQLVEQRARVERVPARVRLEPLDRARRQPHAAGLRQRAQLVDGERREAEPAALGARGGLGQALGQDRRALAGRRSRSARDPRRAGAARTAARAATARPPSARRR